MLFLPVFLIISLLIAALKKVKVYDAFALGTKQALELVIEVFPYLATIFIALVLMQDSGLSKYVSTILAPIFRLFGLPNELAELIVLRPMTGSGSIALLEKLYSEYGADSYVGRCASVIVASSDTVFYITAVYFSTSKDKKSGLAIPIALAATFIGIVFTCFICRFL